MTLNEMGSKYKRQVRGECILSRFESFIHLRHFYILPNWVQSLSFMCEKRNWRFSAQTCSQKVVCTCMFVCLFVCLFAWLSAGLSKNCWTDFCKTWWKDETWAKKKPIHLSAQIWIKRKSQEFLFNFRYFPRFHRQLFLILGEKTNKALSGDRYLWLCAD